MRPSIHITWAVLILAWAGSPSPADEVAPIDDRMRVVSWNVSDDAFVSEQPAFESLLRWSDPDVVLLDEVGPSANIEALNGTLAALRTGDEEAWTVNVGVSGGRQRCVIASRWPQEAVPEFSSIVPYPDPDRRYLMERMSSKDLEYKRYGIDGGIPVNGAIILAGERRLLAVITDLQCCGDDQNSWHEYRRRAEAREIRRLISNVLQRTRVDGVLIAGDFNLVNGPMPLIILSGPYPAGHSGLIPAELYHPDGYSAWTWDGRRTPFPSGTLDFQLFESRKLVRRSGLILDTEALDSHTLDQLGLERDSSARTGRHRPLLIEYGWK